MTIYKSVENGVTSFSDRPSTPSPSNTATPTTGQAIKDRTDEVARLNASAQDPGNIAAWNAANQRIANEKPLAPNGGWSQSSLDALDRVKSNPSSVAPISSPAAAPQGDRVINTFDSGGNRISPSMVDKVSTSSQMKLNRISGEEGGYNPSTPMSVTDSSPITSSPTTRYGGRFSGLYGARISNNW